MVKNMKPKIILCLALVLSGTLPAVKVPAAP